jgi:hypothetical protein
MTDNNRTSKKIFIANYKAAMKAKFTREEFAQYLEVEVDTIGRRQRRIREEVGMDLPYLELDPDFDGTIDLEKVEVYEIVLKELLEKDRGPARISISENATQQVYLITSAQNATPVHKKFFAAMQQYISYRNGRLLIIPYRYKNPTSIFSDAGTDYWWEELTPYLVNNHIQLCRGLQVQGQIKMQPTAVRPLSGLESISGTDSAIFGHPKMQMKTIATPSKDFPKILTTTGACTIKNYTDSKAGHKGRFHHNISALVVEVDNGKFHIRQIHGEEDGSFYDCEYKYTTKGRERYSRIAGFVPGDIHAEMIDEDVERAVFVGKNSIVGTLRPEVVAYHDVEDFYPRNHHHRGNDVIAYGKHHFGRNNVEEGLQVSANFIDRHNRPTIQNLVIASNHNDAFDRWLKEADPKFDPENARFYYYMKFHQLGSIKRTPTGYKTFSAFPFWCKKPLDQPGLKSLENTRFLERDESFMVAGIEIGFHGDEGANGSRGSLMGMSRIGPKSIIGHSHSPGIEEGAYQVGLSARLDLEYARGPSSWLQTHCIIYPNGARTLVNVIHGEWRASYYGKEPPCTD